MAWRGPPRRGGTASCEGIAGTVVRQAEGLSAMALPLENWVCGASGELSPWKEDGTGAESRCGERVVDGAQRRAWGSEGVFASLPAAAQRVLCSREERTASAL